jgi:hypothetical protein
MLLNVKKNLRNPRDQRELKAPLNKNKICAIREICENQSPVNQKLYLRKSAKICENQSPVKQKFNLRNLRKSARTKAPLSKI